MNLVGQRPVGAPTRGTTNANRLRRVDRWLLDRYGATLRRCSAPVVVDLGYGRNPVTTVELAARLRRVNQRVRVVGIEIDTARVAAAQPWAGDGIRFIHGGFEVPLPPDLTGSLGAGATSPHGCGAGGRGAASTPGRGAGGRDATSPHGCGAGGRGAVEAHEGTAGEVEPDAHGPSGPAKPLVIRVANVLRQYPERDVAPVWSMLAARLAPGGVLLDVTCDELGRRCCWVEVGTGGPRSLSFGAALPELGRPGDLAERLPKALIHRNVPGEPVHEFLNAWDRAWQHQAPIGSYGRRQRFIAAARQLRDQGWPVSGGVRRWRLGELTVAWPAVAPADSVA